ncbi:54S ribosomal protein L38 [Penicillium hispanicum]|uniref:54S ribosomal protein L38 n=1 Tax=Penicillium hispanicum TaxID=1080232 RepID=UPI002541C1C2|nr:54S ribosomal protein L38 [Penicillium hispanicum]KAJ5591579.1 54S ribosomal protein L38 [Penicillium hispanicum]
MIQLKTLLNCIDNSGASVVECVNVLKKKRPATIGQSLTKAGELAIVEEYLANTGCVVVVQKQRAAGAEGSSATALANKVRRGDIRHAVVVRVKKELQRTDGTVVRFGDNACVLVNKAGDPIGTRMNGVVGQELRGKQWSKILSLAPVHV